MSNWKLITGYGTFGLLLLLLVYTVTHMLYNRFKGRDELDSLFRFKRRNHNDH